MKQWFHGAAIGCVALPFLCLGDVAVALSDASPTHTRSAEDDILPISPEFALTPFCDALHDIIIAGPKKEGVGGFVHARASDDSKIVFDGTIPIPGTRACELIKYDGHDSKATYRCKIPEQPENRCSVIGSEVRQIADSVRDCLTTWNFREVKTNKIGSSEYLLTGHGQEKEDGKEAPFITLSVDHHATNQCQASLAIN